MHLSKKLLLTTALALTVAGFTPAYAAENASIIHVTGYAEQEVAPDTAFVTIGMETTNSDPAVARTQNTAVMNKLVHAMLDLGIGYSNMKTVGFSMQPRYDQKHQRITHYVVKNNLKVKVTDLKELPTVLQTAGEVGANNVGNINFTCSNTAEIKAELIKQAVTNGRLAADAAATAAGGTLGKPKEININGTSPVFRTTNINTMKLARAASDELAPELQAGTQTISETVDMTFYIE